MGKTGEEYAKELLVLKGCKIVRTNFYSRFGEIDIIAKNEETLIFVEVKTRTSDKFGTGEDAVIKKKLEKMHKTALCFLEKSGKKHYGNLRMDLIAVELGRNLKLKKIKHIKNINDG